MNSTNLYELPNKYELTDFWAGIFLLEYILCLKITDWTWHVQKILNIERVVLESDKSNLYISWKLPWI